MAQMIDVNDKRKVTKIAAIQSLCQSKRRVAAYCRVSTGSEDQLMSLEAQKRHYESYIHANSEWEFAGLYYDEGITGTGKEKRAGLLCLLSDCERRKVDYILTKSVSRFARSTTDCLEVVRRLTELGVHIFFEKENLDTGTMDGELMLTVLSSLAENESVSNSQNYKWGMRHRFRTGTFKLSCAPYGYDCVDGRLTVNTGQAEIVRRIFWEAFSGKGSDRIAAGLNADGIPARHGGVWNPSTVLQMLRNEKYTGDSLLQKVYSDDQFHRHKNRGERDRYLIRDTHEALIIHEEYEAVATQMDRHARERGLEKGSNKYTGRYIFSGKIRCDGCGGTFKRRSACKYRKRSVTWSCARHLKDISQCRMQPVSQDAVERAFVVMMNKLVFGHAFVLKPLKQRLKETANTGDLSQIGELEMKIAGNADRSRALMDLMAKGYLDLAHFRERSNDIRTEAAMLRERRAALLRAVDGEKDVREQVDRLLRYVSAAETPVDTFDGETLCRFVEGIVVYSPSEIGFMLKCGITLRERLGR